MPTAHAAAANDAVLGERDFAGLDLMFPERARPAGHALADLVFQLLAAQTERGGAAVVQQGPGLDRVCLVGRFDPQTVTPQDLGTAMTGGSDDHPDDRTDQEGSP